MLRKILVLSLLSGVFQCLALADKSEESINLYWYPSSPFVFVENGKLVGIEVEIIEAFAKYRYDQFQESLELNWVMGEDFADILETVQQTDDENLIGVSALSITEERNRYASFSKTYFPDVTVMVSSKGTPIVKSFEELYKMLNELEAVTIENTKYENFLMDLKNQINAEFNVVYVDRERGILASLEEKDRFGFIDLPVYMMLLESGTDLTRQNFFTKTGEGYAFMMPKDGVWKKKIDDFIDSDEGIEAVSSILMKYLGNEMYDFINQLGYNDALGNSLLIKEKEMQLELLRNANLKLQEEQSVKRILVVSVSILVLLIGGFGYLFYKNQKNANLVIGQKDQIEDQQEDIRQKNEQLMNRNSQLVALNEEKNNLVKILAHDIRSPLSQIIMIVDVVNQNIQRDLSETEQKLLGQVTKSAERINEMVSKILNVDALEESRVKVMQERVNIETIMKDISQRYKPTAAKKDIELSVTYCQEHSIIRTDHLLLLLVLENLVSNAVKFSGPNTVVDLMAKCEYDNVVFKVSDEGPGFSEEDKKKMFGRFQKLSAKPTGGESSTGLGLSIVKKYVQDLGGKIWVESEEGKGTTFFVKLTA